MNNILLHTFISMFVAKFRSIGEAAIQAGNSESESIIRRDYLDLKSPAEADAFSVVCRNAAQTRQRARPLFAP